MTLTKYLKERGFRIMGRRNPHKDYKFPYFVIDYKYGHFFYIIFCLSKDLTKTRIATPITNPESFVSTIEGLVNDNKSLEGKVYSVKKGKPFKIYFQPPWSGLIGTIEGIKRLKEKYNL